MWIDTHCHLDALEHSGDAAEHGAALDAAARGVQGIVIPAVETGNFDLVANLGRTHANCAYALGIHPVCVPQSGEGDLALLRARVEQAMSDPNFVAIGEIGLDYFIPALCTPAMREKQERYYSEQLKLARECGLPVLVHVRRSQDMVLKHLRRIQPLLGIAHAFNGSSQQAGAFVDLGLKLGFGGAMTFTRALQIRRLAVQMPLEAIVLETDAPDMSPSWLHPGRNSPAQLPAIGAALAELRGIAVEEVERISARNAHATLPRLAAAIGA